MKDSERIVGLYQDNAAAWDAHRGRKLFERAWLEAFAALLPPGGEVLDLGCGSGEPIARWFIEQGFALTGVDASAALVDLCRERFPACEWIVSDMRALELGRGFDGLLAWHSFFHLSPEDQRPMFERFARHLSPGGLLMFTSGSEEGSAIGEWQGEPLYHGSLSTAEYARLLERHGFDVLRHVERDPDCGEATIWLARKRRADAGR
jgi:cyclopropane fatty-acyl-phospholipid synthase-like methyltransferase